MTVIVSCFSGILAGTERAVRLFSMVWRRWPAVMVAVDVAREVSTVDVVSGVEMTTDSTGRGAVMTVSRTVTVRVTVVVSWTATVTIRGLQEVAAMMATRMRSVYVRILSIMELVEFVLYYNL